MPVKKNSKVKPRAPKAAPPTGASTSKVISSKPAKIDAVRGAEPVADTKVEATSSTKPKVTSAAKAKAAFANFTLSRHTEKTPAGYVKPGADPQETHRALIAAKLARITDGSTSPAVRQLNLALPAATLKKLMPSYVARRGKASVSDVLSILTTYARGTTFVLRGNATLRRLALQSQVDQIMKDIQGGTQ
jgi:hypothetical protein